MLRVGSCLLLPKYLEQTNVSLAGTWNVSEGTIRRWRAEIEKLIKEDSNLLTEWNVSAERLERLKAVISSRYPSLTRQAKK